MTILVPIHNLIYNPTLTELILSQAYIHVVIAPIHFGQEYLNLIMIVGDDPHCLLSNGFWGLSQVTQSMHSSDIETLTVITPRAEQLSNERLMGETIHVLLYVYCTCAWVYTCTYVNVHMGHVNVHKHKTCVYMCMGRACTFIHALAMYVYTCRRNEYYNACSMCVYVHAYIVHTYIVHVHVYLHVRVQA